MSDKYGYIGIETLLNFCSNDKNHCVTPNDFMRMNRVKIDERPHGEWIPTDEMGYMVRCSKCNFITHDDVSEEYNFCPNCGTPMNEKALKIFRKRVGGK